MVSEEIGSKQAGVAKSFNFPAANITAVLTNKTPSFKICIIMIQYLLFKKKEKLAMIAKVKQLHKEIQEIIQTIDYNPDEFEKKIIELSDIAKTETFYIAMTTHCFNINNFDKAEEFLKEGLLCFSYSYSLHFNRAMLSYIQQKYEQAFYHFGKCLSLASNVDEREAVNTNLNALIEMIKQNNIMPIEELKKQLEFVKKLAKEGEERSYPIDKFGESLIRKVQEIGSEYENMTNLYKNNIFEDVNDITRYFTKTEYYLGKSSKEYEFDFTTKTTLPISYLTKDTKLLITINNEVFNYSSSTLKFGQYNYLTFEKGKVCINADHPIFIGNPIPLKDTPKKYKLILHTFIDGLSGTYLEKHATENLLVKTLNVFSNKYENKNCYATADWTFPSNAGTVTGMDTVAHGQYHPFFSHDFSVKQQSLIEHIRKNGYFTAAFTGDWRGTPPHGYGKSYNRIVYKNSVGGFATSELMEEVIDHLETFKEKNNYVWIVLPDLHDVADELFMGINTQVHTPAQNRLSAKKGKTSVLSDYDKQKIIRYKEELKRIDLHLSHLLNYIKRNYEEDEVLIIIHSDHGQGYFIENPEQFLQDERTKVPFMLLGGVQNMISTRLMCNLDIYPTILELLNIDYKKDRLHGRLLEDFGGEAREFVFTESYHPDREYRAVIHAKDLNLYFETINKVDNYGRVDLEDFKVSVDINNNKLLIEEIDKLKKRYVNWIIRKRLVLQK